MLPSTISENKKGILDECSNKSILVEHLPYYYHVHLNMPCNQKCIMCVPDGNHKRDLLSFEGFLSFFEQIRPYAEHITLIGGEPLMYPWIQEVLELLADHPIAVTINTNATMLNERIIPRLLALHELNLKCSIDAADPATYYRIRGTDVFGKVTENLARFAGLTRTMENIRLIPVYVVMRENLREVLPFLDFAETLTPHRVEFHPVRHVINWHVTNGTGWIFAGKEQSCEFFSEEYNSVMRQAAERCERTGISYEVQYV
ncbi:radical SAM protein [bacterium]|nr:radical SAM protein [bacterium]